MKMHSQLLSAYCSSYCTDMLTMPVVYTIYMYSVHVHVCVCNFSKYKAACVCTFLLLSLGPLCKVLYIHVHCTCIWYVCSSCMWVWKLGCVGRVGTCTCTFNPPSQFSRLGTLLFLFVHVCMCVWLIILGITWGLLFFLSFFTFSLASMLWTVSPCTCTCIVPTTSCYSPASWTMYSNSTSFLSFPPHVCTLRNWRAMTVTTTLGQSGPTPAHSRGSSWELETFHGGQSDQHSPAIVYVYMYNYIMYSLNQSCYITAVHVQCIPYCLYFMC